MKCSEFLWKYLDLQSKLQPISSMDVCGLLGQTMAENGDTTIVSDTTGKPMAQDDALSVLGRAEGKGANNRLLEAYRNGQKSLFEALVVNQNMSDDEYHAKMAAEEAAAAGAEQ